MKVSRRALFFLAVSAVFLLMIPPTPPEFRWLNLSMAGLALVWTTLLAIEDLAGMRRSTDLAAEDVPSTDQPAAD
jgi:hypothetical protein